MLDKLSDPALAKLKHENADKELHKLREYNDYYKERLKTMKGSCQKGRGVLFYSEPDELLKTLELIIGGITAGNTSGQVQNTGVSICSWIHCRRHQ